jgi:hypothetical protein
MDCDAGLVATGVEERPGDRTGRRWASRVFSTMPFGRQPEDFHGAKARAVNQVSIDLGWGVSDTRKEAQRGV